MATPKYDFEYIAVLNESGIDQTPEIKRLIKSANMARGKYLAKPTTGNLKALTAIDDAIIDEIDRAVEEASKEQVAPPEQEVVTSAADTVPEEKPVVETPVEVPQPVIETPPPAPEPSLEEKVRAAIDGNGRIPVETLKSLIGELNDWDGREKIGALKLRKMPWINFYEIYN